MDAVIHLAAIDGYRASRVQAATALEVNVGATSLLTEVCRATGAARFALASALEVYGPRGREVDETSQPDPQTFYAATKLDAEEATLAAGDGSLHCVVFRLGDVFGAEARADFSNGLNRMAGLAWRRGRIADPRSSRPIYRTHVADVCAALRQSLVCRPEVISGQVFNVGCEEMRVTEDEIAALLAEVAPELARPSIPARAPTPGPVASFQKLRTRLGVSCRRSLRQGLSEVFAHLRREGVAIPARPATPESWRRIDLAATRFLQ
jgi:nucleoside-diphosphate-sugar epimerase